MRTIKLKDFEIGKDKLTILAGPCATETREISFKTAEKLKEICKDNDVKVETIDSTSKAK